MIYPALRISDMERDAREKYVQLQASKNGLHFLIQQKIQPVTFLKENKKFLVGGFLTIFPFVAFLGKSLVTKGRGSFFWKALSLGWLWEMIRISGGVIKTVSWVAQGLSRLL